MPISTPVQVFPNDLKPSVGIGVDIPFNKPGVFTSNFQTKDAIKNNLINFFLTNTGERLLNPTFGGGLRDFIFEQISNDNISNLKSQIQDKLRVFFSRIDILELDLISDPDRYTVTVFLKYSIRNTGIVDNITIDFNQ
jgi:phage baseplate assembly protein W